jgi:hypothetical protein
MAYRLSPYTRETEADLRGLDNSPMQLAGCATGSRIFVALRIAFDVIYF